MPVGTLAELDPQRLRRLLEEGRGLLGELRGEVLLARLLEVAREVTGARYAALGVLGHERRGLARFLTSGIDASTRAAIGELPQGRGVLGALIDEPRPLRLADVADDPRSAGFPPGHPPMHSFLGVPVMIGERAWGDLYLTEKGGGVPFDAADEAALVVLADWAAIAIENARLYEALEARRAELERSVEAGRLRAALQAAEAERRRWARELHDETLQALGGLKMLLAGAARTADPERLREATGVAVEQVSVEIDNLRAMITELRPASLDALGLAPALESLVERQAATHGLEITTELTLGDERLDPDLETAIYRVAQEALTNVAKHAGANTVGLRAARGVERIEVAVTDDGTGFDPSAARSGFGLAGIRERVELAGGALELTSGPDGTRLRASFPLTQPAQSASSPRSSA